MARYTVHTGEYSPQEFMQTFCERFGDMPIRITVEDALDDTLVYEDAIEWSIPVEWKERGVMTVKAESYEEAKIRAMCMLLPQGSYVYNSLEIIEVPMTNIEEVKDEEV